MVLIGVVIPWVYTFIKMYVSDFCILFYINLALKIRQILSLSGNRQMMSGSL